MEDFQTAIDALLRDTEPGKRLPQWKYDALSNYFRRMHGFMIVSPAFTSFYFKESI